MKPQTITEEAIRSKVTPLGRPAKAEKKIDPEVLSLILKRITDGFFVVDKSWTVLFANEPASQISQKPLEEIIGNNLWKIVPQYVDTEIYHQYQKAMNSGHPATFVTYLQEFSAWIETRLFPSPEGLTGYFRDVTAQLKAETNLKQTLRRLEQTTKELSRSNHELTEFAAVASHDLKEPLKSITLWIDLAHHRPNELERADCLKKATDNAHKCLELIDALLEYSRLGKEHLTFTEVPCSRVIDSVKDALALTIRESDTKIIYGRLPHLYVDEVQFTRLFQNLISNAIKYSAPNRTPIITIEAEEFWDRYEFRIHDNGIGISEKDLGNIFQLFRRSESTKSIPGNGIGLATVKKIVELHGGTISVESKLTEGSTFKFSIPKLDPEFFSHESKETPA